MARRGGRSLDIHALVRYEGQTVAALTRAFQAAVECMEGRAVIARMKALP